MLFSGFASKLNKYLINGTTEFVRPTRSFDHKGNKKVSWICGGVPSIVLKNQPDCVTIKPFDSDVEFDIPRAVFNDTFIPCARDETCVYSDVYPGGKVAFSEFNVPKINLKNLLDRFKSNTSLCTIIEKCKQDAYVSKGNTKCIKIGALHQLESDAAAASLDGESAVGGSSGTAGSSLTRTGDPYFNRRSRHSPPVPKSMSRAEYEACPSFPRPIGVREADFAWPTEQNEILISLIKQIFACEGAPELPVEIQQQLGIEVESIVANSHKCLWCGETVSVQELNQSYCAEEHSVNFCHRDPETGTKAGNVYIGHCSCNREQGGHSEEERIEQVLRLVRANPAHQKKYAKAFQSLFTGLSSGSSVLPSTTSDSSSASSVSAPTISFDDILNSY
jgi:hypothetical protein